MKSRLRIPLLLVVGLSLGMGEGNAQEFFLQSDWLYNIPSTNSASIPIWAGGNEPTGQAGTTNYAPHDANGIYLAESAIGQMTAQTAGYSTASADLLNAAAAAAQSGQSYNQTNLDFWNITFAGGFDKTNGQVWPGGTVPNFDTNRLAQAEYDLRAELRINPSDTNAAQQLVLLADARMLPWEWSGVEALAWADRSRLWGAAAPPDWATESQALAEARSFYSNGCNVLPQFLANPPDALLVEGQNPWLSHYITNQVATVVDDYLRNLLGYCQASLSDFQLRSLVNFYDPTQQQALTQTTGQLLNDIDATTGQIQLRLLQLSPFTNLPIYSVSALGQAQNLARLIGRMHDSIVNGRITFIAGASQDPSSNAATYYGEFTTAFPPIFTGALANPPGLSAAANSSFDIALAFAQNTVTWAMGIESGASNTIIGVDNLAYQYATSVNDLQSQYFTQLGQLCGYISDTNGNLWPDLFFSALPPGVRESVGKSVAPTYLLTPNNQGTIYQEWVALSNAQTSLVLANVQLSNTFQMMLDKQAVANATTNIDFNLALMYETNGQAIAAIDVQQGTIQAQSDQAIAQIQYNVAKQQENNSTWGSVFSAIGTGIAAAAAGAVTGGVGAAAIIAGVAAGGGSLASGLESAANVGDQAQADLQIGDQQAQTATQLAALNAQISQIQASEQSAVEYANADQVMAQLAADLDSLRLQANAQELQVQLAAQNVDQEQSKVATLIGQASYLIREYSRSVSLLNESPSLGSQLLTSRNAAMQRANDAFVLAQQWCFLTAECLTYKDTCPGVASANFVQQVLAARNSLELQDILKFLQNQQMLDTAYCQVSPFYQATPILSLRNSLFQFNDTTNTAEGGTNFEPQLVDGIVTASSTASSVAWSNFLAQHLGTTADGQFVKLTLDFTTTLDPNLGSQPNPLFLDCRVFGVTIYSGGIYNGTQVNVQTLGSFEAPDPSSGFTISLSQLGTSALRSQGYGNPNMSIPALRYFNFDPFIATFTASMNGFSVPGSTSLFQERSPANSQWELEIIADTANNKALLSNLGALNDIQLMFSVKGFTDQNAVNCQ